MIHNIVNSNVLMDYLLIIQLIHVWMFVLLILLILDIKDYVLLHVLNFGMQILLQDYVLNPQIVQMILMVILLLKNVLLFVHLTIMQM